MKVEILSKDKTAMWDDFVVKSQEATVFHLSGWKEVIEKSLGHAGLYFMALNEDQVVGVYPLFILRSLLFGVSGVSLPFVGYGGVVADSEEAECNLLAAAESAGHRAGCPYIEMRQRHASKTGLPTINRKVVTVLSTDGGSDAVFARLHANVRNKIRKAVKAGVSVEEGADGLADFYAIYSRNLRDLGTPVICRQFFETAFEILPSHLKVYRAIRQGKTIAAKVVVIDRHCYYFTWSASLRSELTHAPVHAMNWRAIEDACSSGCEWVDLGRSSSESSHHDFKKYWGGETHTLPWVIQPITSKIGSSLNKENPSFSLAIAIWKRLPLGLSRLLGPPIARCLP